MLCYIVWWKLPVLQMKLLSPSNLSLCLKVAIIGACEGVVNLCQTTWCDILEFIVLMLINVNV